MAQATVYVCDRCGQSRAAELSVDVEHDEDDEYESTAEAHLDLCVTCLGRALSLALPHIPMTARQAWFDAVRAR